jgi:hypothetical protein
VNQLVATKLEAERDDEKVSFSRGIYLLEKHFPGGYQV